MTGEGAARLEASSGTSPPENGRAEAGGSAECEAALRYQAAVAKRRSLRAAILQQREMLHEVEQADAIAQDQVEIAQNELLVAVSELTKERDVERWRVQQMRQQHVVELEHLQQESEHHLQELEAEHITERQRHTAELEELRRQMEVERAQHNQHTNHLHQQLTRARQQEMAAKEQRDHALSAHLRQEERVEAERQRLIEEQASLKAEVKRLKEEQRRWTADRVCTQVGYGRASPVAVPQATVAALDEKLEAARIQNGKLSEERKIYRITANNLRNEVNQLRAQYARLLKQYTNIGRMPSDPADGVAVTPSPPATLPYKPSSSVEGAVPRSTTEGSVESTPGKRRRLEADADPPSTSGCQIDPIRHAMSRSLTVVADTVPLEKHAHEEDPIAEDQPPSANVGDEETVLPQDLELLEASSSANSAGSPLIVSEHARTHGTPAEATVVATAATGWRVVTHAPNDTAAPAAAGSAGRTLAHAHDVSEDTFATLAAKAASPVYTRPAKSASAATSQGVPPFPMPPPTHPHAHMAAGGNGDHAANNGGVPQQPPQKHRETAPGGSKSGRGGGWKSKVHVQEDAEGNLVDTEDDFPMWGGIENRPANCSAAGAASSRQGKLAVAISGGKGPPPLLVGEHKCMEVVRKKDEREMLPGHDCDLCRKFYVALVHPNLPPPLCGHTRGGAAGGTEAVPGSNPRAADLVQIGSRHRMKWKPPETQEGYWDIGFNDTPECSQILRPSQKPDDAAIQKARDTSRFNLLSR